MKKNHFITLALVIISFLSFRCDDTPTADDITQQNQEKSLDEAQRETGLPAIHNFQEKKLLKMVYEERDNANLICYAYLYNQMTGNLVFLGKCLGYGIPYATQYSNPEKLEWHQHNGYQKLPQAEPNGLFMPSSSQGTWVMLLDSLGKPHPIYVEPDVIVSPIQLTIKK